MFCVFRNLHRFILYVIKFYLNPSFKLKISTDFFRPIVAWVLGLNDPGIHCPSSSALISSGVWVTKDKAWIRGLRLLQTRKMKRKIIFRTFIFGFKMLIFRGVPFGKLT